MINTDLLTKTLAYIEEHPEEWNQENWRCGTQCCFAGHAALLAGWQWVNNWSHGMTNGNNPNAAVECVATDELGLCPNEARKLFVATNTLDDLRRIVTELVQSAQGSHDGTDL
jgi:hypothetical protein